MKIVFHIVILLTACAPTVEPRSVGCPEVLFITSDDESVSTEDVEIVSFDYEVQTNTHEVFDYVCDNDSCLLACFSSTLPASTEPDKLIATFICFDQEHKQVWSLDNENIYLAVCS